MIKHDNEFLVPSVIIHALGLSRVLFGIDARETTLNQNVGLNGPPLPHLAIDVGLLLFNPPACAKV